MSNEAAGGERHVTATRSDGETGDLIVDYEAASFTVIAPPSAPSTSPPTDGNDGSGHATDRRIWHI